MGKNRFGLHPYTQNDGGSEKFGKLSLETVVFGDCGLYKVLGVGEGKKRKEPPKFWERLISVTACSGDVGRRP